jgi:outer membrane protein
MLKVSCKNSLFALTALTILFLCLTAAKRVTAEVRIAVVDVSRLLNESKEGKLKREELDELSKSAKGRVEKRRTTLKGKEESLRKAEAATDSNEMTQFRNEAKEFARMIKDEEENLRQKFVKVNNSLTQKAIKIIEDYAKAKDIDLVLEKSDKGRGPVLFSAKALDISDEILERLNE